MKVFRAKTNDALSNNNVVKSKRHLKAKVKNKLTGKKDIKNRKFYDRQVRTTMHIEGGLYELFNELFHVLPWIFVIVDVVLGETVFHDMHMESWQLILMLIGAEILILYVYRITLEFRGREWLVKFMYETYSEEDWLSKDIDDYIFKRHGSWLFGRYFVGMYSNFKDTTNPDIWKNAFADSGVNPEEWTKMLNDKAMNIISLTSNWEIFTLKRVYLNYKLITLNANDSNYSYSINSFVSFENKEINWIIQPNIKNEILTTGIISMDLVNNVTSYSFATKLVPGNITGIIEYTDAVKPGTSVSKGFNKVITSRYIRKAGKHKKTAKKTSTK